MHEKELCIKLTIYKEYIGLIVESIYQLLILSNTLVYNTFISPILMV